MRQTWTTDRPFVKCLLSHARVTNDVIGPAMVVFFGNGNVGCVAVRLILESYKELKLSPQEIRGSGSIDRSMCFRNRGP